MVYGSMSVVRSKSGAKLIFEHNVKLGVGDDSTLVFRIPAIGNNLAFLIDQDGVTTSTITTDDITVYVNKVPVTVDSIDNFAGTVTLSTPPSNGAVVTADYMWSEVSDEEILKAMESAEEIVNEIIRGSNDVDQTHVQYIDGDGFMTDFNFDHSDVTSVTSVYYYDSLQTLDVNYYLYQNINGVYDHISFSFVPKKGHKNIKIEYVYGKRKVLHDDLSNAYASRFVILNYLRPERRGGSFIKGKDPLQRGDTSRLLEINQEIIELMKFLDNRVNMAIA